MVEKKASHALKAEMMAVALSVGLVVIKAVAFAASGSLAVLSSLVDSMLDVSVSAMNFAAIKYSSKPADEDHRYGHGKIEGLAALLQAGLIAAAAVFLFFEAIDRALHPQPMHAHMLIVCVMLVSAVISALIVKAQNIAFNHSGSLAIEAEHAHYSSDVVMHAGVIVAVLIQYFNGPGWVDALFAGGTSVWLIVMSRRIGCKGLDMVLDRELPEGERAKILALITAHKEVLGVHDLRATRSGMKEIIAFDIEADPAQSLRDAHAITKDIEREILEIYPDAEVMIHVDPHGDTDDSRHKVGGVHQ